MSQSISVNLHHPKVSRVVYFPAGDGREHGFTVVKLEENGVEVNIMLDNSAEAYNLAQALDKAGTYLNLAGSESRTWVPPVRESE